MLLGAFPLTAFASEDDEYIEPINFNWMYTFDKFGSQPQGGTLPTGFKLDGEHPEATVSIPPRRASGRRFLRWDGSPDIAVQGEDGFTRFTVKYEDFTPDGNGGYTTPYTLGSYYFSVSESGTTVTFNAAEGKLNGLTSWIEEVPSNGSFGISLADFVPEREGYRFLGWGGSESSSDKTVLEATDAASTDAVLQTVQSRSINDGTDYVLYAKWQNSSGDDYTYDEDTKTLTIFTDQGYSEFPAALGNEGLESVEHVMMTDGVTGLFSIKNFRFSKMKSVRTLEISPLVKAISSSYFSDMPSLEEVSIPASVKEIQYGAFENCPKLKTISFADSEAETHTLSDILYIASGTFSGCAVREVYFPRQLQKLGEYVFEGCPLKDVYFKEAEIRSCHYISMLDSNSDATGTFDKCGAEVTLHFPESVAELYKTTVIPNYADIINPHEGYRRYPVTVNNQIFNTDRLQIACGDDYAAFDPQTNTLTLHNAVITVPNTGTTGYSDFQTQNCGINAGCDDLTIVLEGENTFTGENTEAYYDDELERWVSGAAAQGIEAKGCLVIRGSGTLALPGFEDGNSRVITANRITLNSTELHIPSGRLETNSDILIKDSSFDCGKIICRGDLTFQNSNVTMTGSIDMGYSTGNVIFDGGDFTSTGSGNLITSFLNKVVYRGDAGILSGGWDNMGGIHVGAMDVVTDEATGVMLGNLGDESCTVTPLTTEDLTACEEIMRSRSLYRNYAVFAGYDIAREPESGSPLTVYVPVSVSATVFASKSATEKSEISSSSDSDFCRFTVYGGGRLFLAMPTDTAQSYTVKIACSVSAFSSSSLSLKS